MVMLKALGISFDAEKFTVAGLSGADVARGAMSRDKAAFVGLSPKDFATFENEFTQLCMDFVLSGLLLSSARLRDSCVRSLSRYVCDTHSSCRCRTEHDAACSADLSAACTADLSTHQHSAIQIHSEQRPVEV